ncbi:MAG: Ser-Thr-rich GPI-anchored membrane family protein [Bacteroidota bacterium]
MKTITHVKMLLTAFTLLLCLSGLQTAFGSTITVTSPNGGETWTAGTTNMITWTSDVTTKLKIVLLKNGVQYSVIAGFVSNTGSYNWAIPASIVNGADYTVKITTCFSPVVSDVSDATFAISGGSGTTVVLATPNGGETWMAGTPNTITWNSDVTGKLRIVLLKNGVQYAVIAGNLSNTGTYNWLIPAGIVLGTDYTINISMCTNSLIFDVSDLNFAIAGGLSPKAILVNDNLSQSNVSVYPNPAIDVLTISAASEIGHITVLNIVGQIVMKLDTDAKQIQLNINDLTNGVYFIRIENGGTTTSHQLIKK